MAVLTGAGAGAGQRPGQELSPGLADTQLLELSPSASQSVLARSLNWEQSWEGDPVLCCGLRHPKQVLTTRPDIVIPPQISLYIPVT